MVLVTFAAAVLCAGLAQAGHTFNAQGFALRDGEVFRVALNGQLQRFEEPKTSGFGISIFRNDPAVADAFQLEVIESAIFIGQTNFTNADESADPVAVQTEYWAYSTTPDIYFQLNGTRTAQFVTAHGHFQEYTITIGPSVL